MIKRALSHFACFIIILYYLFNAPPQLMLAAHGVTMSTNHPNTEGGVWRKNSTSPILARISRGGNFLQVSALIARYRIWFFIHTGLVDRRIYRAKDGTL